VEAASQVGQSVGAGIAPMMEVQTDPGVAAR